MKKDFAEQLADKFEQRNRLRFPNSVVRSAILDDTEVGAFCYIGKNVVIGDIHGPESNSDNSLTRDFHKTVPFRDIPLKLIIDRYSIGGDTPVGFGRLNHHRFQNSG